MSPPLPEFFKKTSSTLKGLWRWFVIHTFGYDLFISYASKDKRYAKELQRKLQHGTQKLVCFRDTSEIAIGDPLTNELERALGKSRLLVVLATRAADNSDWVAKEISWFKDKRPKRKIARVVCGPDDARVASGASVETTETAACFELAKPSDRVISEIEFAIKKLRVKTKATLLTAFAFFALVVVLGTLAYWGAGQRAQNDRLAKEKELQSDIARVQDQIEKLFDMPRWSVEREIELGDLEEELQRLAKQPRAADERQRNTSKIYERLRNWIGEPNPNNEAVTQIEKLLERFSSRDASRGEQLQAYWNDRKTDWHPFPEELKSPFEELRVVEVFRKDQVSSVTGRESLELIQPHTVTKIECRENQRVQAEFNMTEVGGSAFGIGFCTSSSDSQSGAGWSSGYQFLIRLRSDAKELCLFSLRDDLPPLDEQNRNIVEKCVWKLDYRNITRPDDGRATVQIKSDKRLQLTYDYRGGVNDTILRIPVGATAAKDIKLSVGMSTQGLATSERTGGAKVRWAFRDRSGQSIKRWGPGGSHRAFDDATAFQLSADHHGKEFESLMPVPPKAVVLELNFQFDHAAGTMEIYRLEVVTVPILAPPSLEIRRDGETLRLAALDELATNRNDRGGRPTLTLTAVREGPTLKFECNDWPELAVDDPFPKPSAGSVVMLRNPPKAELVRFSSLRKLLPESSTGLEEGDALFSEEMYDQANRSYGKQPLWDPMLAAEIRYKQGLCELKLNSPNDAKKQFEKVFNSGLDSSKVRWKALAGCQLWIMALEEGDLNGITLYYTAIGPARKQLLRFIPYYMRNRVYRKYIELAKAELFRKLAPKHVDIVNQALEARKLLGTPGSEDWIDAISPRIRALELNGDRERARELAESAAALACPADQDAELDFYRIYARLMRVSGDSDQALFQLKEWLEQSNESPDLHVLLLREKARCQADQQDWQPAIDTVNELLRYLEKNEYNVHDTHELNVVAAARLLQGFAQENDGDHNAAMISWKTGYELGRRGVDSEGHLDGLARTSILGAISRSLNAGDYSSILHRAVDLTSSQFPEFRLAPQAAVTFIEKLISRELFVAAWNSERGHELAQQYAFGQQSLNEARKLLPSLLFVAILIDGSMGFERSSLAQEKLAWAVAQDLFHLFTAGNLSESDLPLAVTIWSHDLFCSANQWSIAKDRLPAGTSKRVAYFLHSRFPGHPLAQQWLNEAQSGAEEDTLLCAVFKP